MKSGISVKEIYDILYKRYGPQDWWPARTDFEVIVGAILTQNTAWTNVEKAIESLRRERLLSARALYDTSHAKLASLIRSAGYYNVKAKRLKHFLDFLFNEYGGDIRALKKVETKVLRNKLLGVNGIGPETCDSIMLYALEKPVFVVDAYTKRIFSRHGFFAHDTSYDEAQTYFTKRLPEDITTFNEYHALIVRLAKEHCRTRPRCDGCPLCLVMLSV